MEVQTIPTPGSVQRDPEKRALNGRAAQISGPPEVTEEKIAQLAYSIWEKRGCPTGSEQSDWFEAERIFSRDS